MHILNNNNVDNYLIVLNDINRTEDSKLSKILSSFIYFDHEMIRIIANQFMENPQLLLKVANSSNVKFFDNYNLLHKLICELLANEKFYLNENIRTLFLSECPRRIYLYEIYKILYDIIKKSLLQSKDHGPYQEAIVALSGYANNQNYFEMIAKKYLLQITMLDK